MTKNKIYILLILIVAIATTWMFYSSPSEQSEERVSILATAYGTGVTETLTFKFTEPDGTPTTELMKHHDRKIHVVIIGSDLDTIAHIHPQDFLSLNEKLESGLYAVNYEFPKAGEYLIGVDGMNSEGAITENFTIIVEGDEQLSLADMLPGETTKCFESSKEDGLDRYIKAITISEKTVECPLGYQITFGSEEIKAGEETRLSYNVKKDGMDVTDLGPFLAAPIHFAIISEDFDLLLHRHGTVDMKDSSMDMNGMVMEGQMNHDSMVPDMFGPNLISDSLIFPKKGKYKVFSQMKHGSEIITSVFVVEAK